MSSLVRKVGMTLPPHRPLQGSNEIYVKGLVHHKVSLQTWLLSPHRRVEENAAWGVHGILFSQWGWRDKIPRHN